MLLEKYEITGSEMPIFMKKEENHLTHEEIVYLGERIEEYVNVGFIPVYLGNKQMFEKVFIKGVE
ncbi:hypothetical protein [Bacillus sp. 1P06AnD]|uniref:hypothetical protein n=1 Tax=Bacillus sp. 1P06AnD TaxID=3132208 RepID=UPI0039A0336B